MRVGEVLEALAKGASEEQIVGDFPYLTRDDVRACLAYAASIANGSAQHLAEENPSPRIAPGSYTLKTLPPLSGKAKAILASVDAVAPFVAVQEGDKAADGDAGIELGDEGIAISLSDEGLPGIDPDR